MLEEVFKDSICEEKEGLMVSPIGGIPQLRTAHFLKPIVSSIEGPRLKLSSLPFSSESEWPLKVSFNGWKHPQNKWKKWVEKMESVYHSVWKAAGIHEAIMGSVYKIHVDKDLIFGLTERWCCETNTFMFPWGEATISLEDMMVLGGFSVLGGPVFDSSNEMVEIVKNLEKEWKDNVNNHSGWLCRFMNSGKKFEHEAFLSLWLSRFVFPGNVHDKIGKHVFPIAVNLARGTRLALAPAVLASIYRDLSLFKRTMLISCSSSEQKSETEDSVNLLALTLWAPLFFVQVWAWERLPSLQPKKTRKSSMSSGVRIGRWHDLKQSDVINVRNTIDSVGDTFLWRPYVLALEGWSIPKFYKEREEWAICEGQGLGQEVESFVRCLRVSELIGLDCEEPYQPHRVAMQFGYDQDFPKWIPRSRSSPEVAWFNYCRPIDSNFRLYYPSRLSESDVTTQYLKWWRKEVFFLADAFKGLLRGLRSKRRLKRLADIHTPPGSAPQLKQVKIETDCDFLPSLPTGCHLKRMENYPEVPPGFPPKCGKASDKSNMFRGVSQIVANNIVAPGSVEKHTGEERFYTSIDYTHEKNESSRDVAHNLVTTEQKRGERTSSVDNNLPGLVDVEVRVGRLERLAVSHDKKNIPMGDSPALPIESNLKQVKVENYPCVPPGFPPKCAELKDMKNITMEYSQSMPSNIGPHCSIGKHTAKGIVSTSTDYAHDRNESNGDIANNLVISRQKRGERTSCVDINLPGYMDLEVRLGRLESAAHEKMKVSMGYSPGLPTECKLKQVKVENHSCVPDGFPPKCGEVKEKKNITLEYSQKVASNIMPPGSVEKQTAEDRVSTSTDYAHGRNDSKGDGAYNLVSNGQKRGERTSGVDINLPGFADLEVRVGRLERLLALH